MVRGTHKSGLCLTHPGEYDQWIHHWLRTNAFSARDCGVPVSDLCVPRTMRTTAHRNPLPPQT